ncbi:transcriptional regulator [Sinisalibacter aestuarii]|uniref:Transcriptional regulator n=1 Tax=Sinisalibacter aestuarii TaxID=2949426 RepID=A0ABQ5LYX6_9RHOB|nr:transcriptional regulator [Sinisalibacter aestuarii]
MPDTGGLKALAHPERLRMLALLRVDGPATASGLARRLGLNSGATSYHLRQLAKHGFIEEAEGQGNARERWWRARHESTQYDTAAAEGEALEAGMALTRALLAGQMQLLQAAQDDYPALPEEWRAASTASDAVIPMNAEAARAFQEKLMALIWEAKQAAPAPGGDLPEGARPFMVMLHAFPFPDLGEAGA